MPLRLLVGGLLALSVFNNFSFAQKRNAKIDSLKAILSTLPQNSNRVKTLISICRVQSRVSTEQMEITAREALALAHQINFEKGEASANVYLAFFYKKTGDTPKAVESLLKALSYYERIHDSGQEAMCLNNIGTIYLSQDELTEALTYFTKAYAVWKKLNSKSGTARALYNLASIYLEEKKDSLALANFTPALALCEEIGDKNFAGQILIDIGKIHLRMKDYETAMSSQTKAMKLALDTEDDALQAQSFCGMSEIYMALNQPEKALASARKALEHAQKITSKTELKDCYYQVYKSFEKLKNYPEAFKFKSLYIALNDSLKNSENKVAIERLKSRYELSKKESELALLARENQADTSRRNLIIAILVALLIIGLLLYNRFRLITQRKLDLKRQQLDLYTRSLIEKSEALNAINQELEQLKRNHSPEDEHIVKIDRILQSNILTNADWEKFKKAFEEIYPAFFAKLRYKFPTITVAELRLAALIKLNLSIKETAEILGISPESVKTSRYRLKKKFELGEDQSVDEFIGKMEFPSNFAASHRSMVN